MDTGWFFLILQEISSNKHLGKGMRVMKKKLTAYFCLFAFACLFAFPAKIYAANDYWIFSYDAGASFEDEMKGIYQIVDIKDGKYYIKLDTDPVWDERVWISADPSKGYKLTPITAFGFLGNGKQAYHLKSYEGNLYMCRYTYASGRNEVLVKLNRGTNKSWSIKAAYGNIVYLCNYDRAKKRSVTYSYNTRTKKLTKFKSNCAFRGPRKGKYVISDPVENQEKDFDQYVLYKFSASGAKKVKTLSKYSSDIELAGDQFIFDEYNKKNKKIIIYKCNLNGSNKKAIASLNAQNWKKMYELKVYKILPKSCIFQKEELMNYMNKPAKYCEYNFAAKKMKAISEKKAKQLVDQYKKSKNIRN